MPNRIEILEILDKNPHLLKNYFEEDNNTIQALIKSIMHYQRHVALHKALKDTNDIRNPIDLDKKNDPEFRTNYPSNFLNLIQERIKQLESQRKDLKF